VGADTPETVTGDNLIAYLRESWSPSTTLGGNPARKGFIGHVAKAVQNRLVTGGGDTGRLALNVYDALQKRHIAVWLKDSAASDALAALGWDGAMRTAEPNYLLIVDSNVGFNKANALITSAYQYEVALKPDLSASADLTITYRHGGSAPPVPCVQRVPDAGYSYAELMDMCFWNYARVYVPKGAPLVDATRQPLAGARLLSRVDSSGDAEVLSSEGGRDAFASLIMVDSGGTRDLHYRYDLPQPAAAREADGLAHYRLAWQKQMGAGPAHVQFALALPPGARPDVARVNRVAVPLRDAPGAPGRMTLEFTLDTDIDLDVAFAPGTAP